MNADGSKETVTDWNKATYQVLDKTRLPDFNAGVTTSLSYKGFTLSANVYFSVGGYVYNSERSLMDSDGIYPFYNQMVFNGDWIRWKKVIRTEPIIELHIRALSIMMEEDLISLLPVILKMVHLLRLEIFL